MVYFSGIRVGRTERWKCHQETLPFLLCWKQAVAQWEWGGGGFQPRARKTTPVHNQLYSVCSVGMGGLCNKWGLSSKIYRCLSMCHTFKFSSWLNHHSLFILVLFFSQIENPSQGRWLLQGHRTSEWQDHITKVIRSGRIQALCP